MASCFYFCQACFFAFSFRCLEAIFLPLLSPHLSTFSSCTFSETFCCLAGSRSNFRLDVSEFRRPSDRAGGDLERGAITDMSTARRMRGLILINTGNGKGKTTAAIGTAFRALGHGMRVGMIQFIKGKWKTGERKLGEQTPNLTWLTMGHGLTWESLDLDRDRKAARGAWDIARRWLLDENYDLVVFDEITYVINYGFGSARRGALGVAGPARRSSCHFHQTRRACET